MEDNWSHEIELIRRLLDGLEQGKFQMRHFESECEYKRQWPTGVLSVKLTVYDETHDKVPRQKTLPLEEE